MSGKRWGTACIVAINLLFSIFLYACGGSSDSTPSDEPPADTESSNWGSMIWGTGKWISAN